MKAIGASGWTYLNSSGWRRGIICALGGIVGTFLAVFGGSYVEKHPRGNV